MSERIWEGSQDLKKVWWSRERRKFGGLRGADESLEILIQKV